MEKYIVKKDVFRFLEKGRMILIREDGMFKFGEVDGFLNFRIPFGVIEDNPEIFAEMIVEKKFCGECGKELDKVS